MAYLVAWIGFNGNQISDCHWQALILATRARVPVLPAAQEFEFANASIRLFATKVRTGEPDPIWHLPDGRLVLADARFELDNAEQPQDDPAAVVIASPEATTLTLVRDRLGQQPLVWARLKDGILVASKESILLAHPNLSGTRISDEFLAAHLANVNTEPDATLYTAFHAVPPGARIELDANRCVTNQSAFEPDEGVCGIPDAEVAARFYRLLDDAVARSCAGLETAGVALSSGLDSSSVALLAARYCSLRAVTFGTQAHGSFDERPLAAVLCARLGIPMQSFDAADFPPSLLPGKYLADPGFPFINPCRWLSCALYSTFREVGADVYLTGDFADFWSAPPKEWLRDALSHRRLDVIWREYRMILSERGVAGVWRESGWRSLLKRVLHPGHSALDLNLFQPRWRDYVRGRQRDDFQRFADWPHPDRAAYNLGSFAATDAAYSGHYRDVFGVQARHPYRDWNLVRFCLSLPAYQGYREGRRKWVARRAFEGLLGEEWTTSAKRGGLGPLYDEYWQSHGAIEAQDAIAAGRPMWTRCLDEGAVRERNPERQRLELSSINLRLAGLGAWFAEVGAGSRGC